MRCGGERFCASATRLWTSLSTRLDVAPARVQQITARDVRCWRRGEQLLLATRDKGGVHAGVMRAEKVETVRGDQSNCEEPCSGTCLLGGESAPRRCRMRQAS